MMMRIDIKLNLYTNSNVKQLLLIKLCGLDAVVCMDGVYGSILQYPIVSMEYTGIFYNVQEVYWDIQRFWFSY